MSASVPAVRHLTDVSLTQSSLTSGFLRIYQKRSADVYSVAFLKHFRVGCSCAPKSESPAGIGLDHRSRLSEGGSLFDIDLLGLNAALVGAAYVNLHLKPLYCLKPSLNAQNLIRQGACTILDSGNSIAKVLPEPSLETMLSSPLLCLTTCLTMARPSPVPPL